MSFLTRLFDLGPADYNDWEIRWALEEAGWVAVALALLIPFALWFFWTSMSRVRSRVKKILLFTLRVVTFAMLVLIVFQPELEFQKRKTLKNSIAVLLDNSKSLSIQTFPAEVPRIDFVKKTLERNRDYLEALGKDFDLSYYFVSDRVDPAPAAEIAAGYRAREGNTDLTKVFLELKKQYEGKSLQGVFLFSDGADLTLEAEDIPSGLFNALAGLEAPVHTFQAGTNEKFKDLAVERIEAADFGFVDQPVKVSVTVYASGIGNKEISVVLKEDQNILASKVLALRKNQLNYEVDLQFVPKNLGKRVYSVSVPLFAGESIPGNNHRDFQVKVIRDRLRVLHLNGRPSWDSRFLREVLANNPKVDLLSFFILRTLEDHVEAPTSELSLIPFPSNLLFSDYLNSFDLIIFQNFQYSPFIDDKYLANIKTFVRNGGAFMMIGGDLSFQGGGYERTPIEEILPVRMERTSREFLSGEFKLKVGEAVTRHPILRLEKDDVLNRKAWGSLPVLDGLNVGLKPAPGAQVLATKGPQGKRKQALPVLVAGRIGKGRSLILATDSSWNWNFRRVGLGGSGRHYQKFWDNVIAWLTRAPETQLLRLETDKERYRENERVLIKFQVLREDYSPAPGRKVRLTIQDADGAREAHLLETDKQGEGGFQFVPAKEGFYSVKAEEERKNEKLSQEIRFGVFGDMAEFQKPLVNPTLLQAVAKKSGGVYQVLNDATDLSGFQFGNPEVLVKTRSKTLSLWDSWWSYGLIAGFLFVEWWARRKSGLS